MPADRDITLLEASSIIGQMRDVTWLRLSMLVMVQPVRMVMRHLHLARTWARTSSSKPRRMLSPRRPP